MEQWPIEATHVRATSILNAWCLSIHERGAFHRMGLRPGNVSLVSRLPELIPYCIVLSCCDCDIARAFATEVRTPSSMSWR
jgi:hypothetical protein